VADKVDIASMPGGLDDILGLLHRGRPIPRQKIDLGNTFHRRGNGGRIVKIAYNHFCTGSLQCFGLRDISYQNPDVDTGAAK
jgi:hypothetical protein